MKQQTQGSKQCFCIEAACYGTVAIMAENLEEARILAAKLKLSEFFWDDDYTVTDVFPCKPS